MGEVRLTLPRFHAKQKVVFDSKATEILVAGDTRGGKSFFIRKAYILFASQIPDLILDIFRVNFDDVKNENMIGETSFPVLLADWEKAGLVTINEAEIIFWNGAKISLHHCGDDKVLDKHRGNACHVRTFAESSQILEHRIRALTGWVTMSAEMLSRVPLKWQGLFPRVYHVTNPIGVSAGYYRRHFVDARKPYSIEKVGQFNRQYIPFFIDDNPSEDKQKTIDRIGEAFTDPDIQKAFINEDKSGITNWHTGTGDFFGEWNEERHVVEDFYPPAHWFRFRGLDLGYAEPFAVYWCAVSDGEPFWDEFGRERWFPRGAFIIYNEWYGCDPRNSAKGLRMRNEDIARGIKERSEHFAIGVPTLSDGLPWQDRGEREGEGPLSVFAREGVPLTKGALARVTGWNAMRGRLIGIPWEDERGRPIKIPMIYFCRRCKYAQDYIPALPRHKTDREDAEEHGEPTHCCDVIRIICMAHTVIHEDVRAVTQAKIERTLKVQKPTMRSIISGMGHDFF